MIQKCLFLYEKFISLVASSVLYGNDYYFYTKCFLFEKKFGSKVEVFESAHQCGLELQVIDHAKLDPAVVTLYIHFIMDIHIHSLTGS